MDLPVRHIGAALDLPGNDGWGRIFGAMWPIDWRGRTGNKSRSRVISDFGFVPTAKEAATILRAMADDGEWWG